MSAQQPPTPPQSSACPCGCQLFHELFLGRFLRDRSQRLVRHAIECAKNGDGFGLTLQQPPGKSALPDVMYAGTPSIRDLIIGSMTPIVPPPRDGRTSGR